ncbi:MAG: hypothetical protein HFG67_03105 [Firmicutes bacterium]|nr:hypothetical protein [Bacillota bacterium]
MSKIIKDRSSDFTPPAVGGASLLVVFAVLCLTVFVLLSLTTVSADDRISEASADAIADYYAADFEAQQVLAQIRAGEIPEDVTVNGNVYSYKCAVSDTIDLSAEVRIDDDGNGGSKFTVMRWQTVRSGDVEIDEGLDVWDGTLFDFGEDETGMELYEFEEL